jgi:hypothetical protein
VFNYLKGRNMSNQPQRTVQNRDNRILLAKILAGTTGVFTLLMGGLYVFPSISTKEGRQSHVSFEGTVFAVFGILGMAASLAALCLFEKEKSLAQSRKTPAALSSKLLTDLETAGAKPSGDYLSL